MGTVAQEITRIKTGKSDIRTSTNAKLRAQGSQEIPENAKIDEYAPYIDDIQQGGGEENAFMQMTNLQGIFAFKTFREQEDYIAGLERYAQNDITDINSIFRYSTDADYSGHKILDAISELLSKNTITRANFAFDNFKIYNGNEYNKTLDLSGLRIKGLANYFFSNNEQNYGILKIKINSETFKEATDVNHAFYHIGPNRILLNENVLRFDKSTSLASVFAQTGSSTKFYDYNDNQINILNIYVNSNIVLDCSYMFFRIANVNYLNFYNCTGMSNIAFMMPTDIKGLRGINLTGLVGNNEISGSADFGELSIVDGSTIGTSTSACNLILKSIWRATKNTIKDGQTIEYWYEKFANALGTAPTGSYTHTITIHTTLFNSLTEEQKALITDKGYVLAYAS